MSMFVKLLAACNAEKERVRVAQLRADSATAERDVAVAAALAARNELAAYIGERAIVHDNKVYRCVQRQGAIQIDVFDAEIVDR